MQYYCLRCESAEEVIGDDNPRCRKCWTLMIKATLSYNGLWFSPRFIYLRMQKIGATYGWPQVYSNGRLKQEREAWVSAMWALGLTELDGRRYWVEIIDPVERTPDAKVHYMNQSTGDNRIETFNIEIVDWEEHVDHPIQLIRRKCGRAYPEYFCLLVFGRHGVGRVLDLQLLKEEVGKLSIPFGEIWIIGRTSEAEYTMVKLYPNVCQVRVDVRRALEKDKREYHIMKPLKRGTGTEVTPLGTVYLPIPRI